MPWTEGDWNSDVENLQEQSFSDAGSRTSLVLK